MINICHKLDYQQNLNKAFLFKEGAFLCTYNPTVFVINQQLGYCFKIVLFQFKTYLNKSIFVCSFFRN